MEDKPKSIRGPHARKIEDDEAQDYFASKDAKDSYWDRIALPLADVSHQLRIRLDRARRNGGNTHAIEKPHLNLRRQHRRIRV